jgi:hypothetical protein
MILIGLLPLSLFGQPTIGAIGGDLSGTLGPGEFIVTDDCIIPADSVLNIVPGTTLLFSGYYTLHVYGQLNAEGTETDSIIFTRQFPTEDCKHGGIRIQPGSSLDNTLHYCRIDYADNPTFPDCWGGGIFCYDSAVDISDCSILNCAAFFGGGIYAINSTISVSNCVLSGCSAIAEGGALFVSFSSASVSECLVTNNTADHVGGLYFYTNDFTEVIRCEVASNVSLTTAG